MKKPVEPAPVDEPEWLFPFDFMDVGDSFFIPTMRPSHLLYTIDLAAKKKGFKVKAYVRKEDNVLGVRTWRVG
jgi:hypothetical protein